MGKVSIQLDLTDDATEQFLSSKTNRGLKNVCSEDYVSMVACQDETDVALLNALREGGAAGRQSGELAAQLDIDHRDVSRRIYRMNKRLKTELDKPLAESYNRRWVMTRFASQAWGATKEEIAQTFSEE